MSAKTGLAVRPQAIVADLSVGEAQRVEILKTLYRGAKILILDEPTAVLSPPEIEELWTVLRGMRERGETIVLITHKLDEVMEISDSITVMRQGRTVDRLRTARTNPAEIAKAMVGRDVQLAMEFVVEEQGGGPIDAVDRSRLCRRRRCSTSAISPLKTRGASPRCTASASRSSRERFSDSATRAGPHQHGCGPALGVSGSNTAWHRTGRRSAPVGPWHGLDAPDRRTVARSSLRCPAR